MEETQSDDAAAAEGSSSSDGSLVDPTEAPAPPGEFEGMSVEACVAEAAEEKARGNEHFKAKRHTEACACYERGVRLVEHKKDAAISGVDGARELLASLLTNITACGLRMERWSDVIQRATDALALDKGESVNLKALFRRGIARSRLGLDGGAKADLHAVCRAEPRNRDARAELSAVSERLAEAKLTERNAFASMFTSGKSLYAAEEAEAKRKAAAEAEAAAAKKAREEEEEAAMRTDWEAECKRLRADGGPAADAESGEGGASVVAAICGESASGEPPITFEKFKEKRKAAEKEAREAKRVAGVIEKYMAELVAKVDREVTLEMRREEKKKELEAKMVARMAVAEERLQKIAARDAEKEENRNRREADRARREEEKELDAKFAHMRKARAAAP